MITSLRIINFILVDQLYLEFDKGLNVITGETGAGKSIVIGAINALFDKKISGNVLYKKDKKAILEASFNISEKLPILKKYDIDLENGEIFFTREFLINGKRKSFINGRRVSQDIFEEFKNLLLDFHNQNKHTLYLEPSFQLYLLDLASKNNSIKQRYKNLYNQINILNSELKMIIQKEKSEKEKIELYRYQLKELNEIDLKPNEDKNLEEEFNKLSNAEDILSIFYEIKHMFYESENSVYDKVSRKIRELENFNIDVTKEAVDYLNNILVNLDNLISLTHQIDDIIYIDKTKLEEIRERLDLINQIKNKYQLSSEELKKYQIKIKEAIENYQSNNKIITEGRTNLTKLTNKLWEIAEELSLLRKKTANIFAKEIEENLHKLSIENSKFKITIDKNPTVKELLYGLKIPGPKGFDVVNFLFTANKDKEPQNLKISASGGELSRIVLTIKKILSKNFSEKTLIFDEIDTGIGGKTATVTGNFIKDISKNSQIITITHIAQIASYANAHFKIEKHFSNEKTKIYLERLDKKNRVYEIARMLAGNYSKSAIKHAKEILNSKE